MWHDEDTRLVMELIVVGLGLGFCYIPGKLLQGAQIVFPDAHSMLRSRIWQIYCHYT